MESLGQDFCVCGGGGWGKFSIEVQKFEGFQAL